MALISLDEAARRTGTSVWTWRKWAIAKRIPSVKLGRRRLVDESDLAEIVTHARTEADVRVCLPGVCPVAKTEGAL